MKLRDQTLGELATGLPAATRVFLRHHLDFCCRGTMTLAQACEAAALDPAMVESELAAEAARGDDAARWERRTPAEIAEHIESHYHVALRRDVPSLIAAARKVERVHAAKPQVPTGLADELQQFWDEMQSHMRKEEEILFPMLRRGIPGAMAEPPIRVMEREHEEHGERLTRIRELTGGMQAPAHACATWRALYEGLTHLEADLMLHIHLENHVLFAQALRR
jgi:regulator of cell morphogenesis and NO signaling